MSDNRPKLNKGSDDTLHMIFRSGEAAYHDCIEMQPSPGLPSLASSTALSLAPTLTSSPQSMEDVFAESKGKECSSRSHLVNMGDNSLDNGQGHWPLDAAEKAMHGGDTTCSTAVQHADESHMNSFSCDKADNGTPLPTSQPAKTKAPNPFKKPLRFWLIFMSLMAVTCLSAIDMTIISTTLPTIVEDLPHSSLSGSWVTSSFLLTTTAFQPMMGGLADVLGRRNALIIAVVLFMVGSVISAVAHTMLVLVIGRGVQGIGGGGVQAIAEIVMSDLTSLRERGVFVGLISLVFAVATFIAPVLGGYFSEHDWRWVFWINLPIGGAALALIIPVMKLNTPPMPLKAKIHRMDFGANMVLLGSVIAILVAVTEGGIEHPWSSWRILAPFLIGWAGMVLFLVLEFTDNRFAPNPVLPRRLFANRTAASCFAMTFIHGIVTYGLIYIIPIYFQAVRGSSPLRSAIELFPATAPSPFAAILAGILMVITGKYRVQIWFWWAVITLGSGLLVLLDMTTPTWEWVILQIIAGFGVGALFSLTLAPIQASLPIEELAHATATFAFCRSFGSVWGIALGTNVFISVVNGKLDKIPQLRELGLTGSSALGAVSSLEKLPAALVLPTREAFQQALRWSFVSFVPICFVGFLISFLVKDVPLPDFNDSKHGLREKKDKHLSQSNSDATLRMSVQSHWSQFETPTRGSTWHATSNRAGSFDSPEIETPNTFQHGQFSDSAFESRLPKF